MHPSSTLRPQRCGRRAPALAAALVLVAASLPLAAQDEHEHHRHAAGAQDEHQHHRKAAATVTETVALGKMSIPDALLLDQDGREVHFYTDLVQGRVVVMNFIFTTCTTICPPMGANFGKLQGLMGERAGRDFEMISVSVDPAVDTPQRLAAWAGKFGRKPGWTLLTGPKPEVDTLLKALKIFTPDKSDHSPILLLGDDARGEWTRAYGLAAPAQLAEMIDQLVGSREQGGSR